MYDSNNIFAKILRGEIPCDKLAEDAFFLAFRDINPQAPVHALVVPKGQYRSLVDFTALATPEQITGFWRGVDQVATQMNVVESGFRIVANHGHDSNQEVPHFHVHILGGRNLKGLICD